MKDYNFGNFLRELRERKGLSQYQLGALVGVSNKAVSKWENGIAKPNSRVLPKLSSVLGVAIEDLLASRDNTVRNKKEKSTEKDALWETAYKNMKKLYGESLPLQVLNRYESEKAELEKNDVIISFSVLAEIARKAKEQGEYLLVRGNTGASFVAYLLHATESNPLEAHYLCPNCKKADFVPEAADGWDLPPKVCSCGHFMKREGHNIPFGLYKNLLIKKSKIELSVSTRLYERMEQIIAECCRDVSKHPVINVLSCRELDMCRELQQYTNIWCCHIDFLKDEVLKQFQLQNTEGIIEFSNGYAKAMLQEIKPQKYSHLLKIAGLAHCLGAWEENGQVLFGQEGIAVDELIAYRDDVYNTIYSQMLQKGCAENGIAYMIAEKIRKGSMTKSEEWRETEQILSRLDLPWWYMDAISKMQYLFPKAHGIAYIRLALVMMWYKVNYPDIYSRLADRFLY